MTRILRFTRVATWRTLVLAVVAMVLASCGWKGVANVPLPGGPGTSGDTMTVYVQMPDTLALNVNSRVRVADVFVGSVRKIELVNWVATLTLDIDGNVQLPENATARIGQTSLLGTQHVELAAPQQDPSAQPLRNGDTIPLADSSAYPTTERTLASIATVLNGGGIPNLEVIQTEVNNILDGNAEQVRAFLGKLDVFTEQLNAQREDLTRAIDTTNELLSIVAARNDTLDRVLTEFPPLIKYFADQRDVFADAVTALGRFSAATDQYLSAARGDLETNLQLLQRPLKQLGRASPYLIGALKLILTAPFAIDNVPKVVRGDYINTSATFDLTLSTLDNAFLTGTGFSGALRALEQAWGRDVNQMIPDVRYTPSPNSVPGGPLVERGE
ncbi:virulence factor Mce family protein [Mycolicibacterium tokaiense]|uniref:Virulence factor Mce family protein n=1 Tax=Mycolicibacterium tokaiense TaxID=39695 RepID=A0A378TH82_9MYCO|nr:mammalian cell entry protein [Mycolicibacterium tokaiense]STZ60161.1 virulence factor Mce family protein [Mycolicibacterium tokaiense]